MTTAILLAEDAGCTHLIADLFALKLRVTEHTHAIRGEAHR